MQKKLTLQERAKQAPIPNRRARIYLSNEELAAVADDDFRAYYLAARFDPPVTSTGWFKPPWTVGLRHYTVTRQSQVRGRTLLDCQDARGETLVIDARDFMATKAEAMAYCRAQAKSAAEHWARQMQLLEDYDGDTHL